MLTYLSHLPPIIPLIFLMILISGIIIYFKQDKNRLNKLKNNWAIYFGFAIAITMLGAWLTAWSINQLLNFGSISLVK